MQHQIEQRTAVEYVKTRTRNECPIPFTMLHPCPRCHSWHVMVGVDIQATYDLLLEQKGTNFPWFHGQIINTSERQVTYRTGGYCWRCGKPFDFDLATYQVNNPLLEIKPWFLIALYTEQHTWWSCYYADSFPDFCAILEAYPHITDWNVRPS
jgi:hypothetical protein